MQASISILAFVLFLCFVFSNWTTPKNKKRFIWLLLLLPFSGSTQDKTLSFDYFIEMTGSDSLYIESATITIEPDAVEIRTPYEFFSRYIVARGKDNAGDEVLFFAGCDKLRICTNYAGIIKGAFLTHRGRTKYFGVDPETYDRLSGWTRKSK